MINNFTIRTGILDHLLASLSGNDTLLAIFSQRGDSTLLPSLRIPFIPVQTILHQGEKKDAMILLGAFNAKFTQSTYSTGIAIGRWHQRTDADKVNPSPEIKYNNLEIQLAFGMIRNTLRQHLETSSRTVGIAGAILQDCNMRCVLSTSINSSVQIKKFKKWKLLASKIKILSHMNNVVSKIDNSSLPSHLVLPPNSVFMRDRHTRSIVKIEAGNPLQGQFVLAPISFRFTEDSPTIDLLTPVIDAKQDLASQDVVVPKMVLCETERVSWSPETVQIVLHDDCLMTNIRNSGSDLFLPETDVICFY